VARQIGPAGGYGVHLATPEDRGRMMPPARDIHRRGTCRTTDDGRTHSGICRPSRRRRGVRDRGAPDHQPYQSYGKEAERDSRCHCHSQFRPSLRPSGMKADGVTVFRQMNLTVPGPGAVGPWARRPPILLPLAALVRGTDRNWPAARGQVAPRWGGDRDPPWWD
jgi:hypothetical protein